MTGPTDTDWVIRADGIASPAGRPPYGVQVAAGEILGLVGLELAGQDDLLTALAGVRPPITGTVRARPRDRSGDSAEMPVDSLASAGRAGVAYLPRERRTEGILGGLSVVDNFAVRTLGDRARFGFVGRRATRAAYAAHERRLSIRSAGPDAPIGTLSGGNQQKVLIARLLAAEPHVLLLNDPTRGVDHATTQALYALFRELAADGCAVVVLSSELREVVDHCGAALVFDGMGPPARIEGPALTEQTLAHMFAAPGHRAGS